MGIVPIENSIEGTINMVADALAQQDIFAHGEIIINIHFGLYALPIHHFLIFLPFIRLHQRLVKHVTLYTNMVLITIMSIVLFRV